MNQTQDDTIFLGMNRSTKFVLILCLVLVSITASIFIIFESGDFFQKFYQADRTIQYMGYWAAALNEIFMAIMAGVWLPKIKKKNISFVHPLNYFFKILLILLFITTVAGSSLNLVLPILNTIQSQKNNNSVIRILKSQVNDNKKSLETFIQQNQKMNSALSVKSQIKIKDELKESIKTQRFEFILWIEVFFIIILRFCIQLANLSCVWLVGWLYRTSPEAFEETLKTLNTPLKQKQTAGLEKLQINLENHRIKTSQKVKEKLAKIDTPLTEDTHEFPRIKNPLMQELTRESTSIIHQLHQKPDRTTLLNNRPYKKCPSSSDRLRRKIATLLKTRNIDISFTDFCKAIEEKESTLRSIVSIKTGINEETQFKLPLILKKIENVHAEGQNTYY